MLGEFATPRMIWVALLRAAKTVASLNPGATRNQVMETIREDSKSACLFAFDVEAPEAGTRTSSKIITIPKQNG